MLLAPGLFYFVVVVVIVFWGFMGFLFPKLSQLEENKLDTLFFSPRRLLEPFTKF